MDETDLIKKRLKHGKPVRCISTQLIEAGVDVDFSSVIRFLAGLDSIAQAAGRCNRNGSLKDERGNLIKGQIFVVNPDSESKGMLKAIDIGKDKAERVLSEGHGDVLSPAAIKQYFRHYFFDRADDMSHPLKGNGYRIEQDAAHEIQSGHGIYYLNEVYYSKSFGLGTGRVGTMTTQIFYGG